VDGAGRPEWWVGTAGEFFTGLRCIEGDECRSPRGGSWTIQSSGLWGDRVDPCVGGLIGRPRIGDRAATF
jgi:hypothetical protein